jgi:small subunit ribosomal protein S20
MRNRIVRSTVRTTQKKFLQALKNGNIEDAQKAFSETEKLIDTAARKGVYHKNAAARTKSRMQKKLNALKVQ